MNIGGLNKTEALIVGGVLAGGALYLWLRGLRGVASDAVSGVGNIAAGVVEGTGKAFQDVTQATLGVPATDADKCAAAIAAGNTFDVSLYCPAGTFLRYLATPKAEAKTPTIIYTAPGGGLIDQSNLEAWGTINDPRIDWSSAQTVGKTFDMNDPANTLFESNWWENAAPSIPVPHDSGQPTQVVPVAGIRG